MIPHMTLFYRIEFPFIVMLKHQKSLPGSPREGFFCLSAVSVVLS